MGAPAVGNYVIFSDSGVRIIIIIIYRDGKGVDIFRSIKQADSSFQSAHKVVEIDFCGELRDGISDR